MMFLEAIYSVQKMADVLITGPDAEREFILFELQQLLDHCPDDTMKILVPVLCANVPQWSLDLQMKAAERLYDVVSLDLDASTVKLVADAAFGVVQANIGKNDPSIANLYNLCGGILVEILPNVSWNPIQTSDVIAMIDLHAKQEVDNSRKIAARILGALSNCFDQSKVEMVVLPRALCLFDDPDVQVRGIVIESLAFIGAALPARVTETDVWPKVERLLDPTEDARIQATAMRTMSHILQHQREKGATGRLFRELLPPIFNKISGFARRHAPEDQRLVDDDTYLLLEVVSEVFGQFVYSLSLFARRSFLKDAYKAYSCMATCNGPLIRRNCAFNLPGVAKALGERFAMELSGLCEFLAKDTDEEVRWILAAGIHQSATLLVPRGNHDRLFSAVCSLLEDENPLVRMNALEHFHELLSAFVRDCTDTASVRRLAPVFSNLSELSEGNWRIQKRLAEQLDKCAEIIPADSLIESVLPLLGQLLEHGTPHVRFACISATTRALRHIPFPADRNDAITRFWAELLKGPFWSRLTLLDGGAAAMRIFSSQLFAELFAPTLLQLVVDSVPNVRIKLAKLLPQMAPMCAKFPSYKEAVGKLYQDKDPDVLVVMREHELAVARAMALFRENSAVDAARFREEQEFYGYVPRSTKRVRGRLNHIRTGRMLSNHRRQSSDFTEPSSGHLSVSQAVISAAKATSAAASAAGRSSSPAPTLQASTTLSPQQGNGTGTSRPASPASQLEPHGTRSSSPIPTSSVSSFRADSPLPRPASPASASNIPSFASSAASSGLSHVSDGSSTAGVGFAESSAGTAPPSGRALVGAGRTQGQNSSQESYEWSDGLVDGIAFDVTRGYGSNASQMSLPGQVQDSDQARHGSTETPRRRERKLRRSFHGRKHSFSGSKQEADAPEARRHISVAVRTTAELLSTGTHSSTSMDQPRSLDSSAAAFALRPESDETLSAASSTPSESVSLSRLPEIRGAPGAEPDSDSDSKSLGRLPTASWSRAVMSSTKRHSKSPNITLVVQQQSEATGLPPMESRAKSWGGRFAILPRQHPSDGRGIASNGSDSASLNVSVKPMRSGSISRTMAARAKSNMRDGQTSSTKASHLLPSRRRKAKKHRDSAEALQAVQAVDDSKDVAPQSVTSHHPPKESTEPVIAVQNSIPSPDKAEKPAEKHDESSSGPSVKDYVRKLEANSNLDIETVGTAEQRGLANGAEETNATLSSVDGVPASDDWLVQSAPPRFPVSVPTQKVSRLASDDTAVGRMNGSTFLTHMNNKSTQASAVATGRAMSVDERGLNKSGIATELGIAALGGTNNGVPIEINPDTGLPSFRGNAPWVRKSGNRQVRHPDGQKMSLSALATPPLRADGHGQRPRTPVSQNTIHKAQPTQNINGHSHNIASFHSDTTHVARDKCPMSQAQLSASATTTSPSSVAVTSGNSRLKSLFGRKKR